MITERLFGSKDEFLVSHIFGSLVHKSKEWDVSFQLKSYKEFNYIEAIFIEENRKQLTQILTEVLLDYAKRNG